MVLCTSATTGAEGVLPPKDEWQKKAAAYSAAHDGVSMLVLIDGVATLEEYPNGGGADKAWQLASGTKSFWGPLMLIAEKEGICTLDERIADTITEWSGDARRSRITVRHLLSLTSGLPNGRSLAPPYRDAIQYTAKNEPGDVFEYSSVSYQCLGEFLKRKLALKKMSSLDYLKTRIFEPIGLVLADWNRGTDGEPVLPWGAHLTAREWAKYGELIRHGGTWKGKEIIPSSPLRSCFIGSKANPSYGLTWWLNTRNDLPADLVLAAGAGDQRMYIAPSRSTVAIRQRKIDIKQLMRSKRQPDSAFSDAEFCSLLFTGVSSTNDAPMVLMRPME